MDLLTQKNSFNTIEKAADQTTEQSIDTQISLPEYCSDIRKILKCFVIPNIFACGISGDRATADGEAVIRVMYVGENEKLVCYEQSVPFSKYIELSSPQSDSCVKATAKTEYVNCRAVSQRRISVSASLSVHFCVSRICREELFSSCDDEEFETKNEAVECTAPVAISEKVFEMSETMALDESHEPVSAIVRTHTCAIIDTVKTVADKMLIKGEMVTDILYCTDSEKGGIEKHRHTMPISQIIDLDGIDENSLCNVDITILSVCVSAKADSEGKNRLLDISVKALASVNAYESCEVCAVSDGYSLHYETQSEFKNMTFRNHIFTYKETKQVRHDFDVSSLNIAEILDVSALKCEGSAEKTDAKICGKGEVPVGILYKTTQGEYGYTEKTVDFSFESGCKPTEEQVKAEPVFTVTEIIGNLVSQSSAEIRMSVLVSMPIFEEKERRVCTKLSIIEDRKKPQCDCPLTVYFSSPGEKIWDIARKYNTTCKRIKEDNDITTDEVTDKTMLLISAT